MVTNFKSLLIAFEADAATAAGKAFPVKLLLTTMRQYPGLYAIVGGFGLACAIFGHVV